MRYAYPTLLLLCLFAAPVLADLRLSDYGASLDGTGRGDDAALERAIADAKTGRGSCVIGWMGTLTLFRQPPPLDRVHVKGDDIYGAVVLKRFPGGILFPFVGGRPGFSGGGLENLQDREPVR